MNPVTLLFFGAQGSGKGTQVGMLIEYLRTKSTAGIIHLDMGLELRAVVSAGGLTGSLIHTVIGVGGRMPDFMPTYLQTKKIVEQFTGTEHIIADGVARGPDQTRGFDDMMQFYGRSDYQIIQLDVSEETSVKRIMARGRNDDTEEAIRRRLAWTKTDVMPQLEFLRSRGRVIHVVDAELDAETVHQNIVAALKFT